MDVVLGDLIKIRFEDGLFPFIQEEFRPWTATFDDPDLVIMRRPALEVGTPVMNGASFSESNYEIARRETRYSVESGKISCHGEVEEDFFDNAVFKPVLIGLLAPRGWGLLHCSAALLDGSVVVFPAMSGTGKTFVLLELLRRGAGYVCNSNLIVGEDGGFVAYPRWMRLEERHFRMFPELLRTAFPDNKKMRQFKKRISKLGFGHSIHGTDPISGLVKYYCNSAYFCHSVRSQVLFPGSAERTRGNASHVFLLLRRNGEPRVVSSDPRRVASLAPASSSLYHLALHRTMSRLAGLRYPTEEEMVNSFRRFFEHTHCYEVHMGESFTRNELSRIVDDIESRIV